MQYRAVDERPLANEFRFRRVLGGSRVLQRTTQIHAIARSERLSALQCQRRAVFREAVISSGQPGIGETPIFAEGSIRGMSGYGMTAVGAKRTFAEMLTSVKCRYCCKSLFASLNTNFPGRTRGDRTIL
jgi:hypothetical protein